MPSPPEPNDINAWHKWFGIECNNLAWTLSEKPLRSAAEDTELLALAHSSAFHWGKVGTELNKTRGHMLLGQAYAVTGIGSLAMKYSQISMLYNQGIINQVADLANGFFTAHTTYVNFWFKTNIALNYSRIIPSFRLICS